MLALICCVVFFACVPLAVKAADGLVTGLNHEWRETALEWAQTCDAPTTCLDQMNALPPVATRPLSSLEIWGMGGAVAVLVGARVWGITTDPVQIGLLCALAAGLLVSALVDFRIHLLPDSLMWPLAILGAVTSLIGYGPSVHHALWGAVLGGLAFWTLSAVFRLVLGRDGLGMGDVKLVAMAGLWLGWDRLPWMVLMAAGLGIAMHGVLHRFRSDHPIAFGPALSLSLLATPLVI